MIRKKHSIKVVINDKLMLPIQVKVMDGRLTSKVINRTIQLIRSGATDGDIKRDIGMWMNKKRISTVRCLISIVNDEELDSYINEREEFFKKVRENGTLLQQASSE